MKADDSTAGLAERRRRVLGPTYQAFYRDPVHLVRGEGVWLYDAAGNRYLDGYNNVASVGHCHPHVVAALAGQARLLNTHTRYLSELIVAYAERLLATCPRSLGHALFTCTGSEANDLAIRIARHATGGTAILVTRNAYHGATLATAAISPSAGGIAAVGAENRVIDAPDTYRRDGVQAREFTSALRAALDDLRRTACRPAALMVDTAFTSDGIFFPRAEILREAAAIIREAGGIFIADEVQAGFGRLGSGMWGFERAGLAPDIVTLGKPMGDGHPIGAALVKAQLIETFGADTGYFNTFGGNPVSAAVGMAVLDVIQRENLVENARVVGAYLRDGLAALKPRHPLIGDVRGEGLCIGVELIDMGGEEQPATAATASVVNGLKERGVLIGSSGPAGNVLKIRPPLPFSAANADLLIEALDSTLADAELHAQT